MPGSTKPGFRTRRYLVNKKFQIKYTLLVISFSAVIYGILGYLLYRKEVANSEILQIQHLELNQMIQSQDFGILIYLAIFFFLQVGSLFILGILITHRIAGPVYRVHKYLEGVAESGSIRPMEPVREQDEFSEFFESLGSAIEKVRARDEAREQGLRELGDLLDKAKNDSSQIARAKEVLKKIS